MRHQAAFLSHLEEMRIDLKLVPSGKVCRSPGPVRVVKDALGLWSRDEVTHNGLLFQGVRQTQWRLRVGHLQDWTAPLSSWVRRKSRG